jgi:hypothetical protein
MGRCGDRRRHRGCVEEKRNDVSLGDETTDKVGRGFYM